MKRFLQLAAFVAVCLAITPAPTGAQISAKLVMEDQRAGEHTLMLTWKWVADSSDTSKPLRLEAWLELGETDILVAERWELCFEGEQALAQAVKICRVNKDGPRKVQFKGREIRTVRGRAWLIETIRTA